MQVLYNNIIEHGMLTQEPNDPLNRDHSSSMILDREPNRPTLTPGQSRMDLIGRPNGPVLSRPNGC